MLFRSPYVTPINTAGYASTAEQPPEVIAECQAVLDACARYPQIRFVFFNAPHRLTTEERYQWYQRMNALGEMMIATQPSGFVVKKGAKLCGMRVIPLVIEKEKMECARQVAGNQPLIRLLPLKRKGYGVVTTGSEIAKGLIEDTFTDVIVEKLQEYGCEMTAHACPGDEIGRAHV